MQDSSSEDDDFCELAYFKTKISIRNTQQNAPRLSLVGGASENEGGVPLDTFFIPIICPHLYIQSSAVKQGTVTTSHPFSLTMNLYPSHSILAQLQECVQLLAEPEKVAQ